jgi:hypothetical protein
VTAGHHLYVYGIHSSTPWTVLDVYGVHEKGESKVGKGRGEVGGESEIERERAIKRKTESSREISRSCVCSCMRACVCARAYTHTCASVCVCSCVFVQFAHALRSTRAWALVTIWARKRALIARGPLPFSLRRRVRALSSKNLRA